jgi:hypothetical protein
MKSTIATTLHVKSTIMPLPVKTMATTTLPVKTLATSPLPVKIIETTPLPGKIGVPVCQNSVFLVVAIVDFIACCMVVNRLVCLTEPIRNEYISIHYKIERTKRQTIVCKHYTKY